MPTLSALLLCAFAATAQDSVTAEEVLDRIDDNLGPAEKLTAIQNRVYEGKLVVSGMEPGTFREVVGPKGYALIRTKLPGFDEFSEGSGWGTVWEVNARTGQGTIKSGVEAARSLRRYATLRHEPWRRLYAQVALEAGELDGKRVHVLRCKQHPRPGQPEESADQDVLYVDREANVVLRLVVPMSMGPETIPVTIDYSNWKRVDDILYAHRREVDLAGTKVVTTVERITHDVDLPADAFFFPEQVRTALNAGLPKEEDLSRIVVENVQAQHAAVIRKQCKLADIGKAMADILPKVMMHLSSIGAEVTGPPFSRYYAFGDTIDFEAGMPVATPIETKGDIVPVTLPAGPTISAWHVGPYEELSRTHTAVHEWLATSDVEIAGPCWEIYWTDPGTEPDPGKWRTQILYPCKPARDGR